MPNLKPNQKFIYSRGVARTHTIVVNDAFRGFINIALINVTKSLTFIGWNNKWVKVQNCKMFTLAKLILQVLLIRYRFIIGITV